MRTMADPKKTAAIYFAMGQAMSEQEGSAPVRAGTHVEASEVSEGLGQEQLTEVERQAVERLARKRG